MITMFNLSPRKTLAVLFLLFIAGYSLFQARHIILGPELALLSPLDGTVATTSLIYVTGTARNVTFISLNDRPIFLNEKGEFEEKYLAQQGQSTIIVRARDRFGRETEITSRIVLTD